MHATAPCVFGSTSSAGTTGNAGPKLVILDNDKPATGRKPQYIAQYTQQLMSRQTAMREPALRVLLTGRSTWDGAEPS